MSPAFTAASIWALIGLLVYSWRIERSRVNADLAKHDRELMEDVQESGAAALVGAFIGTAVAVVAWPLILLTWVSRGLWRAWRRS